MIVNSVVVIVGSIYVTGGGVIIIFIRGLKGDFTSMSMIQATPIVSLPSLETGGWGGDS